MYKVLGARFAEFICFFLRYRMKNNNLVSLRPKYLVHFHGIFKGGIGEGVQASPLNPLWICHCIQSASVPKCMTFTYQ